MPDVGSILRECHIPWPAADEGALREAAAIWHGLAEAIRDNNGRACSAASSLTSNNEGAAIDTFEKYWDKFGARGKGALPLGAEACDAVSKACAKYADDVAAVKRRIEIAAGEIAGTLVIGTAGMVLTFGASEPAADAAAAGIALSAANWIADIGADWIAQLGIDLSSTIGLLSETAAGVISEATGVLASSAVAAGNTIGASALDR